MRDLDKIAIKKYGIPSILLMENAGRACAEEVMKFGAKRLRYVAVICGKGNNGGDGFVASRHLFNAGIGVTALYLRPPAEMTDDARLNFNILRKMKVPLRRFSEKLPPKRFSLVLDALFGTGLSRPAAGPYAAAIDWMNRSGLPIVSIDVPSGVASGTGRPFGPFVRADLTVALGWAKRSSGTTVVKDISIPRQLLP